MLFCRADLENSRGQERWVKPLWWWIWRFFEANEREEECLGRQYGPPMRGG